MQASQRVAQRTQLINELCEEIFSDVVCKVLYLKKRGEVWIGKLLS